MTPRQVMSWVDGLPPESLTLTAVRESLTPEQRAELARRTTAGHGQWSQVAQLLALTADRLAELTWVMVAVNSKKPPKRPKPLPRPGVDDARPGPSAEALRMAQEIRASMPIRAIPKPE